MNSLALSLFSFACAIHGQSFQMSTKGLRCRQLWNALSAVSKSNLYLNLSHREGKPSVKGMLDPFGALARFLLAFNVPAACKPVGDPTLIGLFQTALDRRRCLHDYLAVMRMLDEGAERDLAESSSLGASQPPSHVVIVPGNGVQSVWDSNWYGWLASKLKKMDVSVALQDMPDALYAREEQWLPFIVDHLAGGADALANTIVVGHSSGAAAAMRLAESYHVGGIVLVAAYTSDLGNRIERKSGYFSRPWQWQLQRENCNFIVQFASTDDPYLPITEQRKVRDSLLLQPGAEYIELDKRSHFFNAPFPELWDILSSRLGLNS